MASPEITNVLAGVGARIKRIRTQRDVTLTELAALTGISKSTLSRLESGQRKPSLELLLPLAEAFRIPLDALVGAPDVGDPRILGAGEVAEFDTRVPHWFGAAGDRPVEILSPLGKHGERLHVRAAPRRKNNGG